MQKQGKDFSTLVELLRYRATHQKDKTGYIFLVDGEKQKVKMTYGELDGQARAIAAGLWETGIAQGERAILLYPSGLDFIAAFFGCLYAGVIAVPAYQPNPKRNDMKMSKFISIVNDCAPKVILTDDNFLKKAESMPDYADLKKDIIWMASNIVEPALAEKWQQPAIDGEALAFLQYTSGSTGKPKGVMVSHGNILYNEEMSKHAFGHDEQTIFVSWLPQFHDMGLVGDTLQPLYLGVKCVFMSPTAFLRKPFLWLEAISCYKATTIGSPNFGYEFCVGKTSPEQLTSLNLNSLQVVYNGSEPVSSKTLDKFSEYFGVCGLNKNALYPCYGMAEASLFISGGIKAEESVILNIDRGALAQNRVVYCKSDKPGAQTVVGCGRTWLEQKILIVNPETSIQCNDNEIGEIWVQGGNVAQGYWNNPELTEKIFRAYLSETGEGPFLRTEDLGFMKNGELFVTGRIKDLIIICGQNHYPRDVELTAEQCHKALRPGCGAAFSIETENGERLVVVQEVLPGCVKGLNEKEVFESIKKAVGEQHGLQVYAIVLLRPRTIPKTSSGKIQRRLCKEMFLTKTLKVVAQQQIDIKEDSDILEEDLESESECFEIKSAEELLKLIVAKFSQSAEINPDEIDVNKSLSVYGLDSLKIAEMQDRISALLPVDISENYFFIDISISELSQRLFELIDENNSFDEDEVLKNIDNLSEEEIDALLKSIE